MFVLFSSRNIKKISWDAKWLFKMTFFFFFWEKCKIEKWKISANGLWEIHLIQRKSIKSLKDFSLRVLLLKWMHLYICIRKQSVCFVCFLQCKSKTDGIQLLTYWWLYFTFIHFFFIYLTLLSDFKMVYFNSVSSDWWISLQDCG